VAFQAAIFIPVILSLIVIGKLVHHAASAYVTQFGHDVGIENKHHDRSAGRVSMIARGGSKSMSAPSGMASACRDVTTLSA
jgi:hypothetical protein